MIDCLTPTPNHPDHQKKKKKMQQFVAFYGSKENSICVGWTHKSNLLFYLLWRHCIVPASHFYFPFLLSKLVLQRGLYCIVRSTLTIVFIVKQMIHTWCSGNWNECMDPHNIFLIWCWCIGGPTIHHSFWSWFTCAFLGFPPSLYHADESRFWH